MPATLDILGKDYYMAIVLLNGRVYFVPCSVLTTAPLDCVIRNAASLKIKDSCITNRNLDEILSVGDHSIEDYIDRSGTEDCVFVDNLIDKMLQASTDKQLQSDNGLIQLFMDHAILQAIKNANTREGVNEESLDSWVYVFVTPIDWGKRVTSDALYSVFAGSKFITPTNTFVVAAFEALLCPEVSWEIVQENDTIFKSKNILCELSIDKTGDAVLSMDIFSIAKLKGVQHEDHTKTVNSFPSRPTRFSKNRIQMNMAHRDLVALLRDTVKENIGLSALLCNELLDQLSFFLLIYENGYLVQSSNKLDELYPFEEYDFPSTIVEQHISALRSITLQDICTTLSYQWELIVPEILSLIEEELCIAQVFFIVIPEVPHLYPDPIEDVLLIIIVLMKLKLEAISIKKFKFIYDHGAEFYYSGDVPYKTIDYHVRRTALGVGVRLAEKLQVIYQTLPPLSSLPPTLDSQSNINTINYVYLSTTQVHIQSLGVDASGRPNRLRAQKSDIITLDQFLVMDTMESKSEETMLQFHISESALSLLESLFPTALHEFNTLYIEGKEKLIPEDKVADVSCLNLDEQLFHSESTESCMDYPKVMSDLVHRQSESGSSRVYMTQQKHIGTFLMVYFGYLKETLARDFGQDSDSTRYILIFEHLMRNATIGHADDSLLKKALDQCGWVPETEENKRKLMVYNIEDNFPIWECLQQEGIKMIPAKKYFTVVTITRYYAKICIFQALEDILPTDRHYKAIKGVDYTFPFDFYETICDTIWHHVLESIYKAEPLLEYPSDIDIMDLEFTLESYKSFKVAFMEYILNTFPFTYNTHLDEKHRFPLHLKQGNYSIVLTNRLVLLSGVCPAFASFIDLTIDHTQAAAFVFYRPSNFDDEKNLSLPMLRLIEIEAKKLLDVRFKKTIWISQRQFSSVHPHQCLKLVNGDTPFGYEALKTGVIRYIEPGTFAIGFQYFDNDKALLVEAVTNQPYLARPIQGADACILTKIGAPCDNTKNQFQSLIPNLALKIPNVDNVLKIYTLRINDTHQRNVGDIVTIKNHDHTILSITDFKDNLSRYHVEAFMFYPFLNLYLDRFSAGSGNRIVFYSVVLDQEVLVSTVASPPKVDYFDSYEEKSY